MGAGSIVGSGSISTRPLDEKEEAAGSGMWKYELTAKGRKLVSSAERLELEMGRFWGTLMKE